MTAKKVRTVTRQMRSAFKAFLISVYAVSSILAVRAHLRLDVL
jgi:hypothetical protein